MDSMYTRHIEVPSLTDSPCLIYALNKWNEARNVGALSRESNKSQGIVCDAYNVIKLYII